MDIEDLFKSLKNRSPKIPHLWVHQADILREYYKNHLHSHDVSLELPTGSGKTLVGLLIGEYRRRVFNERVLYLCSTKQLAYQVLSQANEYGIDARAFIGSKRGYRRDDLALYRLARVIAISTYSGLFNTNPGLNDPQVIILDDTHSAESYIASMWSIVIDRLDNPQLYSQVLEIFENVLPTQTVEAFRKSSRPRLSLKPEKVPSNALYANLTTLRYLLDSAVPSPEESDLYFSWTVVREGLHACHIYISWNEILIRPYIPPTLTHRPFAGANQRIYMSATLGTGGELERSTGIRLISRIPTPPAYISHGVGRRLFMFPDFAKDPQEYEHWIARRLSLVPRTLMLCPTKYHSMRFQNIINKCSPSPKVLSASDVEESIEPFTNTKNAILVLTNRYDGIDLPQEDCRQLIIFDIPSKTNLQEAFLEERLGLEVLLRERIKTRITQATGRCTRSDIDYAAVIMVGRALLDFCARAENQRIFHPEIRAEIRFALEQAANPEADFDLMLDAFFKRDQYWSMAEQNIAELRASEQPQDTDITKILSSVAQDEIDYSYALWSGNHEKAIAHGRTIVDGLSGPQVAPYRALWCYFVASAAYAASSADRKYETLVDDFTGRAVQACRTVSWFAHALKSMSPRARPEIDANEVQALAVEGIRELIKRLGVVGPRFVSKIDEIEEQLESSEPLVFDKGLEGLGNMLGFSSWKPQGDAEPDCVWHLGDQMAFLLEGKSGESSENEISVKACQQASGHLNWAKEEKQLRDVASKWAVLVSPRSRLNPKAIVHSRDVFLLPVHETYEIFKRAKSMLLEIRSRVTGIQAEEERTLILEQLINKRLDPDSLRNLMLAKPVADLPQSK